MTFSLRKRIWFWSKIALAVLLLLFLMVVGIGVYRYVNRQKTQAAIDAINGRHLTMEDVTGTNLPPRPDQKLNDSTVAGIDANANGIRDDVELAIFQKYPNDAKIRAAELQYAQALQLELTQVFNSETLVAALNKEDLAYDCIGDADLNSSFNDLQQKEDEIRSLVFDDISRKKKLEEVMQYMTTYLLPNKEHCDVAVSS